jgi:hypothetical protein
VCRRKRGRSSGWLGSKSEKLLGSMLFLSCTLMCSDAAFSSCSHLFPERRTDYRR